MIRTRSQLIRAIAWASNGQNRQPVSVVSVDQDGNPIPGTVRFVKAISTTTFGILVIETVATDDEGT